MESCNIPPLEVSQARAFIAHLGRERGFMNKQFWDQLDEAGRAELRGSTRGFKCKMEPFVKVLSQSSHDDTSRFVFELLQNAENNSFQHTKSRGESSYISFHLSKDLLVVDCNEDGFTTTNVSAICSASQSPNPATKGLGFKSVFMAASKVHIQSGPYSFVFQHRPSDKGLGMIRPMWQEPIEELPVHMTRMTLDLHTEGDPESISAQRYSIRQKLKTINGNVLLFMKNLEEIRIIIDENGSQTSTTFSKKQVDDSRIKILKTVAQDNRDTPESSSTLYHITKHRACDLAENENCASSIEALRRRENSTADVVLAFPLTSEYEPIIESQEVFAPLPVEAVGFSFLVKSDFVTTANREHIVTTSKRNIDLRRHICEAFVTAALQFCRHKTLQFSWVKFIPDTQNRLDNDYWTVLVKSIQDKVRKTPLFWSETGIFLRYITNLRNPRPTFVDKQNNLVLRDLVPELSISHQYQSSHLEVLMKIGLQGYTWKNFTDMVEQDLRFGDSWIRNRPPDGTIRSKVACLLTLYCKRHGSSAISEIQKLPIIPLQDGRWLAAAAEEKIYFPDTAGLTIPDDLQFNLVDSSEATCPYRRELFELLGVESLSVSQVRERIFTRLDSYWCTESKVRTIVQQLKFLYSTHDNRVHHQGDYRKVVLIDSCLSRRSTADHDVYLPDDDPLGPRELLKPFAGDNHDDNGKDVGSPRKVQDFKVSFIHKIYLEDDPKPPQEDSRTWRNWLVDIIGLRRRLRLTNTNLSHPDLSQACYHVARRRPDKFIPFLIHHWPHEGGRIACNVELREKLRKVKVLCQGNRMVKLRDTWLPLTDLQSKCNRFLAGKADFPFLQLEQPMERNDYSLGWASLPFTTGIRSSEDLAFYSRLLLAFSTVESPTEEETARVLELYSIINDMYQKSMFKTFEKATILSHFKENSTILIPSVGGKGFTWAPFADCLWEAPPYLSSRHPLKALIQPLMTNMGHTNLSNFFYDVLEIPNCDYSHILHELKHLSDTGNSKAEDVFDLYGRLNVMIDNLPEKAQGDIRSAFSDYRLIYAGKSGQEGWHQMAQCLWACKSGLPGWTILEPRYKDLHEFFVKFLGVKTLTLELVHSELDRLGSSSDTTRDQVEPILWTLNSFISAGGHTPDAKTLLDRQIFPVRYPDGHVRLEKASAEFAIVDRRPLGDIFKHKVKTLDLDLDQVRRLGPTLSWLGLGARYLSEAVREVSQVQGDDKELLSSPERSIKHRAHALYRLAYHYNSPRLSEGTNSFYQTLKNAQVYETDGITATLYMSKDGHETFYEKGPSNLHIEESDGQLRVFVPRDKRSQESCYARKLPSGLFRWLMTPSDGGQVMLNEKGLRVTASVLNSGRSEISEILEDEGIAVGELDDDYEEVEEVRTTEGAQTNNEFCVFEEAHIVEDYHAERSRVVEDPVSSSEEDPMATPELTETEAGETSSVTTPASPEPVIPNRKEAIHVLPSDSNILNRIVDAGTPIWRQQTRSRRLSCSDLAQDVSYFRVRSDFAVAGPQQPVQPTTALPDPVDPERTQSQTLLEGVATTAPTTSSPPSEGRYVGALYNLSGLMDDDEFDPLRRGRSFNSLAFELLKEVSPGLPEFSAESLNSNIRRHLLICSEYSGHEPWEDTRVPDFQRPDKERVFTKMFTDKGYLRRDIWDNTGTRYLYRGPELEKATVFLRVYADRGKADEPKPLILTFTWSVRSDARV